MGHLISKMGHLVAKGGHLVSDTNGKDCCCDPCVLAHCPSTMRAEINLTFCPGCIGPLIFTGTSPWYFKWIGTSIVLDLCLSLAGSCTWSFAYVADSVLAHTYFDDMGTCDPADIVPYDTPDTLVVALTFDPVTMTFVLSIVLQTINFGLNTGMEIYRATLAVANCTDPATLTNDFSCYTGASPPYPGTPPGGLATGTVVITPGGC